MGDTRQLLLRCSIYILHGLVGAHNRKKPLNLGAISILVTGLIDFLRIIKTVRNLVWHHLNDIDVFYKNVLGITLNIKRKLLRQLSMRHDIVHRNGFDLEGNAVAISNDSLSDSISTISIFVEDIDKKYQALKLKPTSYLEWLNLLNYFGLSVFVCVYKS